MGYPLTYHHNIPHGMANGIILSEFLKSYEKHDKEPIDRILNLLKLNNLEDFRAYIKSLSTLKLNISPDKLKSYASYMISNDAKLKNHPFKVTHEEIFNIYMDSLS